MEKMREHGQAVLEQNEEQKKFYPKGKLLGGLF